MFRNPPPPSPSSATIAEAMDVLASLATSPGEAAKIVDAVMARVIGPFHESITWATG